MFDKLLFDYLFRWNSLGIYARVLCLMWAKAKAKAKCTEKIDIASKTSALTPQPRSILRCGISRKLDWMLLYSESVCAWNYNNRGGAVLLFCSYRLCAAKANEFAAFHVARMSTENEFCSIFFLTFTLSLVQHHLPPLFRTFPPTIKSSTEIALLPTFILW